MQESDASDEFYRPASRRTFRQRDSQKLPNLLLRPAVGLQTSHELLPFDDSALFDTFFLCLLLCLLHALLPDAGLADVVELEHAANLLAVHIVIAPDQHLFCQLYYHVCPVAIRLLLRSP